ncbi:MAG: Rpn family recombination-promoting nuclease/putative transposase [Candidatus Thiodiazotropha sp.]
MNHHDHSYKLLFSHPQMVRDLLLGFVHEAWVAELDFSTLERVNTSYISENLRRREDDIIWRVRRAPDDWLYIYLLVEFQSQPDPWMAMRMLVYVGLLYQELIKGRHFTKNGKLPPVFPLVLYNGEQPWKAAEHTAEMIEPLPGGLVDYRPDLRYLLIDENHYAGQALPTNENLAAALFHLENSQAPEELQAMVKTLNQWLYAPEQASLRRAFTVWLKKVLLPARLPDVEMPDLSDLNEVSTMLAERVKEWTQQWKAEGMQEGLEKGRKTGEATMLCKMLELKYGPLPAWAQEKIAQADAATLEQWATRLFNAQTLDEVFNSET